MVARILEPAQVGVSITILGFTALWTLPRIFITVATRDRYRDDGLAGRIGFASHIGLHVGLFVFLLLETMCSLRACAPDAAAVAALVLVGSSVVARVVSSFAIGIRRRRAPPQSALPHATDDRVAESYVDPGWGRGLTSTLTLRGAFRTLKTRKAPADGLVAMRAVFVGLVLAVWLMLFVLTQILVGVEPRGLGPWPYVVGAVGAAGLAEVLRLRTRPLDGSDPVRVALMYRNSFFIGIGFSESAAIVGVVASLLTARLWLYVLGLAFSTVGFTLLAPTRRDIARRQDELRALGSTVSLGRALQQSPRPKRL
jgi:hypothetical protein